MQLLGDLAGPDGKFLLIRRVKRLLFLACHFPALDEKFIKYSIERPRTAREELEAYYESSSNSNYRKKVCMIAFYMLYCCKNFYIVYEAFRLFDYKHPERSIEYYPRRTPIDSSVLVNESAQTWPLPGGSSQSMISPAGFQRIACMSTNCTRLAPAEVDNDIYRSLFGKATLATLADDFHKLPLFHICHPLIDKFYTPVDKLDSFGVLAFACSAFNVFLMGVFINVQQLTFPSPNEMIFFLVAPVVTTRLALDRTNELARDVQTSYKNFCRNPAAAKKGLTYCETDVFGGITWASGELTDFFTNRSRRLLANSTPAITKPATGSQIRFRNYGKHSDPTQQRPGVEIEAPADERSHLTPEDMADCMPIIRTEWWREAMATIFLHALITVVGLVCLLGIFCFVYIQIRVVRKRRLLEVMGGEISRSNCSIWLTESATELSTTNSSAEQRPPDASLNPQPSLIDVAGLDMEWSLYAMVETSTLNLVPGICASIVIAYYLAVVSEIMVWLAEVRMYLVATLVVARLKLPMSADMPESELVNSRTGQRLWLQRRHLVTRHVYNMAHLRQRFKEEARPFFVGSFCRVQKPGASSTGTIPNGDERHSKATYVTDLINSKLVDRTRESQFIDEILNATQSHLESNFAVDTRGDRDDVDLEHFIETVEMIYINFRLFIEHIRNSAPGNASVFITIYLLNYGLAVIGVVSMRKMQNLKHEPMFLVILALAIANVLILIGANFHADAKKLQPIIWSIIARMTHSNNLRIKHLRFLWLKQVQILDDQGGIALNSLSMRVTYINILQLAIWTATIIIIAIR